MQVCEGLQGGLDSCKCAQAYREVLIHTSVHWLTGRS